MNGNSHFVSWLNYILCIERAFINKLTKAHRILVKKHSFASFVSCENGSSSNNQILQYLNLQWKFSSNFYAALDNTHWYRAWKRQPAPAILNIPAGYILFSYHNLWDIQHQVWKPPLLLFKKNKLTIKNWRGGTFWFVFL